MISDDRGSLMPPHRRIPSAAERRWWEAEKEKRHLEVQDRLQGRKDHAGDHPIALVDISVFRTGL